MCQHSCPLFLLLIRWMVVFYVQHECCELIRMHDHPVDWSVRWVLKNLLHRIRIGMWDIPHCNRYRYRDAQFCCRTVRYLSLFYPSCLISYLTFKYHPNNRRLQIIITKLYLQYANIILQILNPYDVHLSYYLNIILYLK